MSKTNKKESASKEKLIPLTARHHESSYNAISELAEEFKVGKAVVVRMSTAGHLEKYLGQVRFIDEEQGRTINENIVSIGNIVSEIRNELRRIGINYNQEIKIRNIAKQIAIENEAYKKQERYADLDMKIIRLKIWKNPWSSCKHLQLICQKMNLKILWNAMNRHPKICVTFLQSLFHNKGVMWNGCTSSKNKVRSSGD